MVDSNSLLIIVSW